MTSISMNDVLKAVHEVANNKGLDIEKITAESSLTELQFDSLEIAEILVLLEEVTQSELDILGKRLKCVGDFAHLTPPVTGNEA